MTGDHLFLPRDRLFTILTHLRNFDYQINVMYLKRLEQCFCAKLSELLISRSNFPLSGKLDFHARPRSDYYYFSENGNYITQIK